MDTTAAAELGVGSVGAGVDGVGFWDGGSAVQEGWPEDDFEQMGSGRGSEGGGWPMGMGGRSAARQGRQPPSGAEPSHKRIRNGNIPGDMSGEHSGGPGYAGRPGSGGYGGGAGYSGFSGPNYGGPEDGVGFQGSRVNTGYNGGIGGVSQVQGNMRGSNSFSGDYNPGIGPPSTASSVGPGSITGPVSGRGRGTGSIFFKTKICSKFRAGICPYNSNCNFAHGMEELRKPPPGWEDIVAAQEAERALRGRDAQVPPLLPNQGPPPAVDLQRFHKTRPCRKYYTEEGCPYGDRCNFLHDDQSLQSRAMRESNAISLGPTTSTGNSGGGGGGNGGDRPTIWKSRICNKWETTGHCPFGQKCHFAHGFSDGHASAANSRHGGVATSLQIQRQVARAVSAWKGPVDEISTIYGDWIEDDEWEYLAPAVGQATDLSVLRTSDPASHDIKKDDKAGQAKLQTPQQLNVTFFRGNNGHDGSGKKQNGQNELVGTSRDGNGHLNGLNDLDFRSAGDLDGEDGWGGEL